MNLLKILFSVFVDQGQLWCEKLRESVDARMSRLFSLLEIEFWR